MITRNPMQQSWVPHLLHAIGRLVDRIGPGVSFVNMLPSDTIWGRTHGVTSRRGQEPTRTLVRRYIGDGVLASRVSVRA